MSFFWECARFAFAYLLDISVLYSIGKRYINFSLYNRHANFLPSFSNRSNIFCPSSLSSRFSFLYFFNLAFSKQASSKASLLVSLPSLFCYPNVNSVDQGNNYRHAAHLRNTALDKPSLVH